MFDLRAKPELVIIDSIRVSLVGNFMVGVIEEADKVLKLSVEWNISD